MSYESELAAWGRTADTEIAGKDEQIISLGYQLAAADQALLEKNAQIEGLLDTVDIQAGTIAAKDEIIARKNATITRLRAERDALKIELAECQGTVVPEPSVYPASLGYCPDPNTPSEVNRLGQWSGGKVRRSYKSPGAFPSVPTFAGDAAAGLRTAHTIKGPGTTMQDRINRAISDVDRVAWKTYIAKSAKNSILGMEHEPEDDRPGGELYRQGQRWFSTLVREVNAEDGGSRLVAGNLMSYTSPEEIATYYPGDGVWDIFGTDGYNWPNRTPGSTTIPRWVEFEEIFRPDYDNAKRLGLDFAIFEYGCRKDDLYYDVNNDNLPSDEKAARQADWHRKAWPVIQELKPVVATYFHHDWWLMQENGHLAMGGK